MSPVDLNLGDLLAAALSLTIGAGASIFLALGLHRSLLVAVIRMCAQLTLVGLFLRHVFAVSSWAVTICLAALMISVATYEVASRQHVRFRAWIQFGIGGVPVALATVFVTGMALTTSLRGEAWRDVGHLIPLVGIILGSVMNSTSLALNAMLSSVQKERSAIEARLSLGADRQLALHETRAFAARNGMLPVVNQMAGAGIVTLPGVMTGQILAGMDPLEAAKHQILLILLMAGASLTGVIVAGRLVTLAVTDRRDRLRLDRLERRSKS